MHLLAAVDNGILVRELNHAQLVQLAAESREFLIQCVLEHGGHFAGNLGVVELTISLLHCMKPDDRLIWDVGHQSYVHKMLTGRLHQLKDIRTYGGISGFPKMGENPADAFGTGHSSTAVSASLGMAVADKLYGEEEKVTIAVVGDGALTGGQAYEAINNAAATDANVLIVINDNHISIDASTGSMDLHLQEIVKQNDNFFTFLGLPYAGPVDGHDLEALTHALQKVMTAKGPRVLHVKTVKGKGYAPAEQEQTRWHSTSRYVKIEATADNQKKKWHEAFGEELHKLADRYPEIVGITPAMPSGSGLLKCFRDFPNRFFDVGIAEQHAVTFAAGLAAAGAKPFLVIYSTFLQRGYDQLIHDIALQKLPVVICIDRAGLVGEDGPTHHGAFDLAALQCIPGLKIATPHTVAEMAVAMENAVSDSGPVVIRYPKGSAFVRPLESFEPFHCLHNGTRVALVACGKGTELAIKALGLVSEAPSLYHISYIKPFPAIPVDFIAAYDAVITVEDGSVSGGFGEKLALKLRQQGFVGNIQHLGIPDAFIPHGDNEKLYDLCGYSPEKIAAACSNIMLSGHKQG
jgi:1-deoxy-D-xylulose-5-phosphate synthase